MLPMWKHIVSELFFILLFARLYPAEDVMNVICDVAMKRSFQLQLAGPLEDDQSHIVSANNIDICTKECCDDTSCDVAVFVYHNQFCMLIDCPPDSSIEDGPCRSYTADSENVASYAQGYNTTLIYIKQRAENKMSTSTPPTVSPSTSTSSSSVISTTITTTTVAEKIISVHVTGVTEIQLPQDSVDLQVHVDETPEKPSGFKYEWELIDHPVDFNGKQTMHGDTLSLSTLTAGAYQFKVTVTDTNAHGIGYVNVTVLEPLRVNEAPVAVISPDTQILTLPIDTTVLDGSSSHDDAKIVSYHWEMQSSPLQAAEGQVQFEDDQPFLQLSKLVVGDYQFELTVTDSDGVTNSTTASLTVKEKIDHKPIAYAGSNQLIHLPQDSLTLCGNGSTDDWGIVEYKWSFLPDKIQAVDMQGARTMCVHLSHLIAGEYTFLLTVTDASEQEDTAQVTVTVLPESNHPPVAEAGDNPHLILPMGGGEIEAHLDGSKSIDDKGVKGVQWRQTSGPSSTIQTPNSLTTIVGGISETGNYVYTLTVTDEEGASASDDVTVTVDEELPPEADAGPDVVIQLPDDVVTLDGSNSHDNYGIQSYLWTRDVTSPAVGRVLHSSEREKVLWVAGLTQGKYIFHLTVTNVRGKQSTDAVLVSVLPDPLLSYLVELHMEVSPKSFAQKDKDLAMKQISLLLGLTDEDNLIVRSIYPERHTGDLVLTFTVELENGEKLDATHIVEVLRAKLQSEVSIVDVNIKLVDTYVCKNNCSGHGQCRYKECICDVFWMENFFRLYFGDGVRNCDWSVLYVVIVICVLVIVVGSLLYCIAWKLLRRKKVKQSKRRRRNYSPLHTEDADNLILKRNGITRKNGFNKQNSSFRTTSLMRSMTSSSSAEEDHTLYEKRKLISGPPKRTRAKQKSKQHFSPLIEYEGFDQGEYGDGFDGKGLDKGVSLRGVGSSEEIM
ncbi:unnamed protein product [Clavelina lepadiformis]|uniref:PKD/Chitinase domain-containing protein n=1 Tax=Clavelina lepadiformis TaxID=159417 RepID=A0ABP0FWF3_CLALP